MPHFVPAWPLYSICKNCTVHHFVSANEVIVYRVMKYRPCTSLPKVNLYITELGGDFWKYLDGEFVFHATIKIHNSFIVCRISFSQEDVNLQSYTEQYFIVNKLFWENWVKFKIQTSLYACIPKAYWIIDICTVWIGHNLLISFINKPSQLCTLRLIHTER